MRILTVAGWMYPDAEGGSFRVVYELGRRLAARGHDVRVATQRLDSAHAAREVVDGMTVHRYDTDAKSGVRFYRSTLREVQRLVLRLHEELNFDAAVLHHPVSAYAAARASCLRAVPKLMVLHSIYFLEYLDKHTYDPATGEGRRTGPLRRTIAAALKRLDGAVLKRAERIVVLSEFTRRLVEQHYPGSLAKVTTSHGGADLEAFRPDSSRAEARGALGLPKDVPVFFSCRRIEHRMGVSELVEACHLLKAEGRRFLALVAGKGTLEAAVQARIETLGLGDSLRLLGYVPEESLRLHYRAADCSVLPTRALEGFGLVTAESLACGTPVIGTPVGATPEILRPLDPRLLATDCRPEGIAAAMARFLDELLGDEDLPQRCRAYAEANLSWEPMTDTVEHLLGEMAAD